MQTLRKLPTQAPTTKARPSRSQPPSSARMESGDVLDSTAGTVTLASGRRSNPSSGGRARSPSPAGSQPNASVLRADQVGAPGARVARPGAAHGRARVARGEREAGRRAGRGAGHAARADEARQRAARARGVRVVVHEVRLLRRRRV